MPCCGLIQTEQPVGSGASPEIQVQWGYSLTLGGRWYMEDYHTARIEEIEPGNFVGLFAVYDGHGGRQCVQYVQRRLFRAIISHAAFAAGDTLRAMYEGYMLVDQQFSRQKGRATCGTTATTVILRDDAIHVAHCGDSRAVLIADNSVWPLTKDHKPSDPLEAERIRAKGGTIVHDDVDRVCGVLAVTRAFGNNAMKATVSAEPEVLRHTLQPYDRHVVIASDGVWDVLSNEDIAIIVRSASSCRAAAEDITLEAYRLGSSDNISAVVFEVNASGPWSRSARVGAAVRSFSNRGVKPKARPSAAGAAGGAPSRGVPPPTAPQGPLTGNGLPHGITTTVGNRNTNRGGITMNPPLSSHPEHPLNLEPSSQEGLGSDDGTLLGPPPPISQPAGPGDPAQSSPTEPAPGGSGVPSPPDQPAPDPAEEPDFNAPPHAASAAALPAEPAETLPGAPAPLTPDAIDAAAVDTNGVPPLPASPGSPESPYDTSSGRHRVCQSAPIFQGRSATIAREYAKDRGVYVHRLPHSGAGLGAVEEEEAEVFSGDVDGGSLPVQARRRRGHVYEPPQRTSREGAAAVVRGGELHLEGDVAAQQRAAVAAAEEDARVRARQRQGAWHTE